MTKKVIELIRVSTKEQAGEDRAGIPAQLAANKQTAAQYGLEIIQTVQMVDVSGAEVLYEPAMQQLLNDIRSPEIDGVVTKEFSRLMRPENYGDWVILQRFVETNTLLYLPTGPLDFSDKRDRVVAMFSGMMSGYELSTIKERMMGGKEAMRRAGKHPGGKKTLPPDIEYDRATGKYSYKPESAKMREVFHRFLAGDQNYKGLAEYLGVKSATTVKNRLRNPLYMGWREYAEQRDLSPAGKRHDALGNPLRDRKRIPRSQDKIIRHKAPGLDKPLVSEEAFARVQVMIADKIKTTRKTRLRTGQFTYNSFLYCVRCGAPMITTRNQQKEPNTQYYYICSAYRRKLKDSAGNLLHPKTEDEKKALNRDDIEPVLDKLVSTILADPKELKRLFDEQMKKIDGKGQKRDRERMEALLVKLRQQRATAEEMAIEGLLSKDKRVAHIQKIDKEIQLAQGKLAEYSPLQPLSPNQLAEVFRPFRNWDLLTRTKKRLLLNSTGARFMVCDLTCSITGIQFHSLGLTNSPMPPVEGLGVLTRPPAGTNNILNSRLPVAGA